MASIEYCKDKDGIITSFKVRIFRGYDNGKKITPKTKYFKAPAGKTNNQIKKEAERIAIKLEEEYKQGYVVDNKQTFAKYAEYVIALKERSGLKHTTVFSYRGFMERINQGIGHLKLSEIRPQHLNELYAQLAKEGLREGTGRGVAKVDLAAKIREHGFTFKSLSETAGCAECTVAKAVHGEKVAEDKARAMADVLGENANKLFDFTRDTRPLSSKTIKEHHNFISAVFAQAEKEMLIPYNPASKATPPKVEQKEANYFEPEVVKLILKCAAQEPLKWRIAIHLLAITGARRGEIAGLKWDEVDFENNQIYIKNNLIYTPDVGTYESTPKTNRGKRYVKLPDRTMKMLMKYRDWQQEQSAIYDDRWVNSNYVFTQKYGEHMHPDSLNKYLDKFSERYNLPHINPHAFRHSAVSDLIDKGIDATSISRRVGHAKTSTTLDIYSHMFNKSDAAMTNCLANSYYDDDDETYEDSED